MAAPSVTWRARKFAAPDALPCEPQVLWSGGHGETHPVTADKARKLEDRGRFEEALAAYQEAFDRSGQDLTLAGDMGRLALRLGQHAIAEKLLRLHLAAVPDSLASQGLLAHALRELHRYEEAIAVLSAALQNHPEEAALWAGLGTALVQQGRPAEALPFIEEAIRLDQKGGGFRYLRANALADLGDHAAALADYAAAERQVSKDDRDRVRLPMALSRLAVGDLVRGWADYEARLSPHGAKPVAFETSAKRASFDTDAPLKGPLALIAEQGLGDEVMFANIVPDVARALGDEKLVLAVEKRLVPLFARSFPDSQVVAHRTWMDKGARHRGVEDGAAFGFWAPMAAPLRRFRRKGSDFPAGPYLQADPARVAHWRGLLAQQPGRKVGLLWKSLKLDGERLRSFAGFDLWRPVLQTPGVSFVNLQYGDCTEELAYAREQWGVEIWSPPGIDLRDDLDDVAALTCALDLTLGFANATINLAGACGATTWLIAPPGAWTMLGTDAYPWYPQVRVFTSEAGWGDALAQAAQALVEA
jgi:tetratricopeptide (TPR) repeat protein